MNRELMHVTPADVRLTPLFDLSFPADCPELTHSIRRVGIIEPVLARRREERLELIAGFRRVRAAREIALPAVPVVVVAGEAADDPAAMRLRIHQAAHSRPLNDVEKSRAICRLLGDLRVPEPKVIAEYLPLLGLQPAAETLRLYQSLDRLSPGFQDLLVRRGIAARHAAQVAALNDADRAAVEPVAVTLGLGGNKIRDLVTRTFEIARREDRSMSAVLAEAGVEELLADTARTTDQRWQQLARWLARRRLPTWDGIERELRRHVRDLRLPEGVVIDYPEYLEGDRFQCRFVFRTVDDVRRAGDALRAAADEEPLRQLVEML